MRPAGREARAPSLFLRGQSVCPRTFVSWDESRNGTPPRSGLGGQRAPRPPRTGKAPKNARPPNLRSPAAIFRAYRPSARLRPNGVPADPNWYDPDEAGGPGGLLDAPPSCPVPIIALHRDTGAEAQGDN